MVRMSDSHSRESGFGYCAAVLNLGQVSSLKWVYTVVDICVQMLLSSLNNCSALECFPNSSNGLPERIV